LIISEKRLEQALEKKQEIKKDKPKICLVTGGAGFIGSHLCDELVKRGYAIYIVDNLSQGKPENIEHLMHIKNFRFFHFDITSDEFFLWLKKIKADYVFHLASPVGVPIVMQTDAKYFKRHYEASKRLFNWALKQGAALFFASTSEVYGNPMTQETLSEKQAKDVEWFLDKGDRYRYGYLKRGLEILLESYDLNDLSNENTEKQPSITIGRFFNVFGPRQNPEMGMVIPRFVDAALKNEALTILGTGSEVRSFCPVSVATQAILDAVLEPKEAFQILNIGSSEQIQISELAQLIKKLANSTSSIVHLNAEKESGRNEAIHTRIPDISVLKHIQGNVKEEDWIEYLRSWIQSEKNLLNEYNK